MVGLVIISHSAAIAKGVKDLAAQMAPTVPIAAAGGTADEGLGTDMEKIMTAIESVYSKDGVILLFDLGSARMNAEMAMEFLSSEMQKNVELIDAALVEGAIVAAVESSLDRSIVDIKEKLKPLKLGKMV